MNVPKFHSTQDSLTREFASTTSGRVAINKSEVSKKMSNISGASSSKQKKTHGVTEDDIE